MLIGGLLRPTPAHALGWRDSSFGAEYDAADDQGEVNAGAYVDRALKGNMAGTICMTVAVLGICTEDESKLQLIYNKSAIGGLSKYMAMMYSNPPADLALWIQDSGQTLGFLPKQVYAQGITQGIGFSGLAPLLPIWKAFRNIAYFLLAIVMIVIGFMVMFRKKIDPKTVVTVQSALPRIVITLLLITFSYAIVGILIDIMYLTLLLVISLLVTASNGILGPATAEKYLTGGFPTLFGALFGGGFSALDDIMRFLSPGGAQAQQWLSEMFGSVGQSIGQFLIIFYGPANTGPVGSLLLVLLLSLALLFGLVRVFFMLLNAYIQIIIALLVSPFHLLLEAFPGGFGFSSWIKNLVSNLVVFPVTAALLLIGTILTQINTLSGIWTPPLLGLPAGVGDTATRGITGLIGLGMLMIIPTVVNGIKEALKAKPAIPAGLGPIVTPVTGVIQTGMGTMAQFYYGRELLRGIKRKPQGTE